MRKFFLFLFVLSITELFANEVICDGIHYSLLYTDSKECMVIKDTPNNNESNYSGMISIPSTIDYNGDTYKVVQIASMAFYQSKVTLVVLPNTVKTIGDNAFSGCKDLEKVILSSEVLAIPKYCFSGCTSLKSIELPENLTVIGEGAFQYTALESLSVPKYVSSIGKYAFESSSISKLKLSDSLKNLGDNVFRNCSQLDSIFISDTNAFFSVDDNLLISKDNTTVYFCSRNIQGEIILNKGIKKIASAAFCNCSKLTGIVFNEGLDSIGGFAFSECSEIKEFILPKGLRYIGPLAFNKCTSCSYVHIPNTVKVIDSSCFYYTPISEVTIPGSVELIGSKAFYVCDNLYNVNVRCPVPPQRDGYLFPLNRQMSIHVLKGLRDLYEMDKNWNQYATFYDDLDWVKVDSIVIDKQEYYCNVLDKITASAIVYPDSADACSPEWSSSDESVVYIDKTGTFIGLKEGCAEIYAKAKDDSGIIASAVVHVTSSSDIRQQFYEDNSDSKVVIYDINGVRLNIKRKGLNIIRMGNGKTKKVMVK